MKDKPIKYDLNGYEIVKDAILNLINQCPATETEVVFGILGETYGFAMIPVSSSVIESKKRDITGKTSEVCYYPFTLVYRDAGMNEKRKLEVSEMLDDIGKWLEKQEIIVNDESYKLFEYPVLTGGREFLEIQRQTNSYLANTYEDKSEDWEIRITARYKNEYK